MKIITSPSDDDLKSYCKRPAIAWDKLMKTVDVVFDEVGKHGDVALSEYSKTFDNVTLDAFQVTDDQFQKAASSLDDHLKDAIRRAYQNIKVFHEAQRSEDLKVITQEGVECWQKSVPIDSVGLYIPGGTAPLFSTVLMLGIPAQIAGCSNVILCSPPQADGEIHSAILFTAQLCGINKVYRVGGSQAIAAMTLGTDTIPPVNKIFGPGNQYVTAAKQKAQNYGVSIDLPAGPSEVLVYADESGVPSFVAADLLSQAEHGIDSQVVLVCNSEDFASSTLTYIKSQSSILPRKKIINECLKNSVILVIEDTDRAFKFINDYAPEHFIIASERSEDYVSMIQNAGSVFLGNYSPESAGDYASGTNHTLPTSGFAKSYSGTNLDSFMKKITYQKISKRGLENLGQTIMTMAREENLDGHANAVQIRLDAK